MHGVLQDARYALRTLQKSPGFTALAVLTLALGIGANTALFSVVHSVLVQPLPYQQAQSLVVVAEHQPARGRLSLAYPDFLDWHEQNTVFENFAAYQDGGVTLSGLEQPIRLRSHSVSAEFLSTFHVAPRLGRDFAPADDRPGAAPVVLLTDHAWRQFFQADPQIVGRNLTLDERSFTVVGVLPANFEFFEASDVYVPLGLGLRPYNELRGNHAGVYAIGRLKPGVSLDQATAAMNAVAARLEQEYPRTNSGIRADLSALSDVFTDNMRVTLPALMGAVMFVLLIATTNLAQLLLVRSQARRREIAVRQALGASRWQLARLVLSESLLLSAFGGLAGVALAPLATGWFASFLPEYVQRLKQFPIDPAVLLFALLAALGAGLAFGLAPLWQASGFSPQDALKQGTALTSGRKERRIQQALVSSEVALSLVLLIGAGLMARSLLALSEVDPGFATEDVVAIQVQLGSSQYSDERRLDVYHRMVDSARALPGVSQASLVTCAPLGGGCWASVFVIAGRPSPPRDQLPQTNFNIVEADYFRTLDIPLLRGRYFDQGDGAGTPLVAVINESFARRYWPNEDPIGQRLKHDYPDGTRPWFTVVGVVGDVKREALDQAVNTEVYFPLGQHDVPVFMTVLARTKVGVAGLGSALRKQIQAVVPDLPIGDPSTLEQFRSRSFDSRRLPATLLALFAAAALVLALIGVFGLTSRAVLQRVREIGLRIALGAEPRQVVNMVVRQSLLPIGLGTVAGLLLSLGLTRTLQSLLFGVEAVDPVTLAAVSVLLAGAGLLACYVPARRAARVDPLTALRYE